MITREKVLQQIKASDVYDDNLKPIEGTVEGYWWLKCYSPNPKIFTRRLFKCGINSYPSARLDEDLAMPTSGNVNCIVRKSSTTTTVSARDGMRL
jgi:hypothetical protein